MQKSCVVEEGETEAVFARPSHPYTRLLLESVPPDDSRATWPPDADAKRVAVAKPAPAEA